MYNVGDVVSVKARVVEVVSNEDYGTRYGCKLKANDKMVTLTFEEDELGSGSTPDPVDP